MGTNAPAALRNKAVGERSEDFRAAVRRKSNGIMQAVGKGFALFRQSERRTQGVRLLELSRNLC